MGRVEGYTCDVAKCDSGVLQWEEMEQVLFLDRTYVVCLECAQHMTDAAAEIFTGGQDLVFGNPFRVSSPDEEGDEFYLPVVKGMSNGPHPLTDNDNFFPDTADSGCSPFEGEPLALSQEDWEKVFKLWDGANEKEH